MSAWEQLSHDPRRDGLARMRASDADRHVVQSLLNSAYADGRLAPFEHDQRVTELWQSRTLGDLRALMIDLVPEQDAGPSEKPAADRSVTSWRRGLPGFLVPSIGCVLLWRFAAPGLFWPLWVIVYTGLPLLRRGR
ncbi:DUF1707 domain-containing protein [Nocardioides sp. BP30]|uniref:DUF1707 SHOCT-like domain-containing protein n=1 Tax=Nocardioides sp. BP30 TaxID=3036374 RepID=UPI00246866E1|nr:DUF1707 domain-containing protein [Nocardioides sp. BP30]WGL52797.1 DUF1707 domain-containing protein [Nocardioides sp. BP30]